MPAPRGSPRRLLEMSRAFWETRALAAAVEMDLFTRYDRQTFTEDDVAEDLRIHPRGAAALLPSLASLRLLTPASGRRWKLAPEAARHLVRGKPGYVGDYVLLCGDRMYRSWLGLNEALRTGAPRTARESEDVFASMSAEETRRFTLGMHGMSQDSARHAFRAASLRGKKRLVDVGGGSGAFLHEALAKWKTLQGVLFDREAVLPVARELAQRAGARERIEFIAGDFFKDPLPRGDAIVLSKILHDWPAGKCRAILRACEQALEPGGHLLIVEWFLDDDRTGPKEAALGSLNMLVETEGANHAWGEYETWAREAGFAKTRRRRLRGAGVVNGVLVCTKESPRRTRVRGRGGT